MTVYTDLDPIESSYQLDTCRTTVNSLIENLDYVHGLAANTKAVIDTNRRTTPISTLVFFGDSLTAWGHSSLASPSERSVHGSFPRQMHGLALKEPDLWGISSYNQGTSGETAYPIVGTSGAVARYAAEVSAKNPDIVFIQLGTNDLHAGTSLANYLTAMGATIDLAIADGTIPVVMSIPDADGINNAEDIPAWNLALKTLVSSKGAMFYDWNGLLGTAGSANPHYQKEGTGPYYYVHQSFAGTRKTALSLVDFIRNHILLSGITDATIVPYNSPDITYSNLTALAYGEANTATIIDSLTSPDAVDVVVIKANHQKMVNTSAAEFKVADFLFYGTGVGVVSALGSNCGQIAISTDGSAQETVDLYSPEDIYDRVVWHTRGLDMAQHTTSIVLKNTKNASSTDYVFRLLGFAIEGGGIDEGNVYNLINAAAETGSGGSSRWTEIEAAKYTQTPSSTSVLLMSDTSDFLINLPVKYTIGGTVYYGLISNISANTSITVSGAPLSADVTNLFVGQPEGLVQLDFYIPNAYADGTTDNVLLDDFVMKFVWYLGPAWFVRINAVHGTNDTGAAQPYIKPKLGASTATHSGNTNKGIVLSVTSPTITTADVGVVAANAKVDPGELVDIVVTKGTNGNAADLTCAILFVLE